MELVVPRRRFLPGSARHWEHDFLTKGNTFMPLAGVQANDNRLVRLAPPQNSFPGPPQDPPKQTPPIHSRRAPPGPVCVAEKRLFEGKPPCRKDAHGAFIGNFDKKSPWLMAGIGTPDPALNSPRPLRSRSQIGELPHIGEGAAPHFGLAPPNFHFRG
jgi:hypothetical protein